MFIKNIFTVILTVFVLTSTVYALVKEIHPEAGQTGNQAQRADLIDPEDSPSDFPVNKNENGSINSGDVSGEGVSEVFASDIPLSKRLIVYYFHRSIRCTGCENIEEAAFEAVSEDHQDDVERGILEWRSINIDEAEHEHFIEKYNIYYQELVFVEIGDDVTVRSDDIAEVWQHWNSKQKVRSVVNNLIDEWLAVIETQ